MGGIGLAIAIGAAFLAVLWIIFPFIVFNYLGTLIKEAKKQTALLEEIAAQGRGAVPVKAPSSVGYSMPKN